jgi:mono/diheme cytochrome c family protein
MKSVMAWAPEVAWKPVRYCTGFALLLAGMQVATALAADTGAPDAARGQRLYERHCGACHAPGIHYRRDTLPVSRDELVALVDLFRRQAGLAWTPEEINDVVEYLNRTRYHFPPK